MHRPVAVSFPEALPRFCAAAGHPLAAEAVTRQAPDFSCLVEGAAGEAVARCSLWSRHTPAYPQHTICYIGHYAATDAEAAQALLAFACERLAAEGCTLAVGPLDGNTWQRYRLLTERGSEPLFFLELDNPDEWPAHWTTAGFESLASYYSALNAQPGERDPRVAEIGRRIAAEGFVLRTLDPARFEEELRAVHALSLESFQQNFLYTPITSAEFLAQYRAIQPVLRPELALLLEQEGRLLGFLFGVPDMLEARRGEPIRTAIAKTLAVHPSQSGKGLGTFLMGRFHEIAAELGYQRVIHALMSEDNRSRKISRHTAQTIRRYTLYSRSLDRGTRQ
jgi:GNAT superfamily N-acetyltransferase